MRQQTRSGVILCLAACLAIAGLLASCGPGKPPQNKTQPGELNTLSGPKPPIATRASTSGQTLPESPGSPAEPGATPTDFVEVWNFPNVTSTPLTLPDYPIPTPKVSATQGPLGIPADASPVTRIVIPIMGLDTVVKFVPFDGNTWLIGGLKQEVAWMGDTSWPGLGSNTGLAGHVDLVGGAKGPFWNLSILSPGDQVVVYTEKYIFTYQMRGKVVVEDYDLSVIDPTVEPQLTLITCTNWDAALRVYLQRLVVFADLVEAKPLN